MRHYYKDPFWNSALDQMDLALVHGLRYHYANLTGYWLGYHKGEDEFVHTAMGHHWPGRDACLVADHKYIKHNLMRAANWMGAYGARLTIEDAFEIPGATRKQKETLAEVRGQAFTMFLDTLEGRDIELVLHTLSEAREAQVSGPMRQPSEDDFEPHNVWDDDDYESRLKELAYEDAHRHEDTLVGPGYPLDQSEAYRDAQYVMPVFRRFPSAELSYGGTDAIEFAVQFLRDHATQTDEWSDTFSDDAQTMLASWYDSFSHHEESKENGGPPHYPTGGEVLMAAMHLGFQVRRHRWGFEFKAKLDTTPEQWRKKVWAERAERRVVQ